MSVLENNLNSIYYIKDSLPQLTYTVTTTTIDHWQFQKQMNDIWKMINSLKQTAPKFIELKCKNCGGNIQQKYEDNIIKCPYCKSAYLIGISRVNDG